MASRFAELEARVSGAVLRHLANAEATFGNGQAVAGIFDNGYALGNVGLTGMASTQPTFTLPTASISGEPVGQTLMVNAISYYVSAHEPDGTGMSRLILELA